ncbi:recombinase family protein [Bradyrhizobium sp. BR 1432]|uniref:recombinase family protein n=1 Tax=Bradyrhizobium sp. BR 1432 TaxID=3447966 RepID=UPI003EE7825B
MGSELVKPDHLDRKAVVYVRQSTPHQVINNQESLKLQYALSQRARELGWREIDIDVIDSDLGQSGAAAAHRKGFKDLVARVTLGEVGLILSMDVTRLARNCSDWYPLLDVCGHRRCLIADRDGIYDPGTPNGRLLLGLKAEAIPNTGRASPKSSASWNGLEDRGEGKVPGLHRLGDLREDPGNAARQSSGVSRAVASRGMGQPCFTVSPIVANADTRWPCVTRAAVNMSAII